MLMPDRSHLSLPLIRTAVDTIFAHYSDEDLSACHSIHDFVWLIEPDFYPQDDAFTLDPRKWAAAMRPSNPAHDPVVYFLLPLVDASANSPEEGNDPLAASLHPTPTSIAQAVFDLYTHHYDDIRALLQ